MTLKVDGTNGVLQAYDAQVLTTGFTYTFAQTLIAVPAGTLATGTVTMPTSPADGMVINIESTQQITALTVAANTGQTMVGGTVTLRQNQPLSWVYRLSNTTWYPFAGAANSQLVSGTAVTCAGQTSIDFTGIPSWAKRITVMFNGVSTSGTSAIVARIGSGSVDATGYAATNAAIISTACYCTTFTTCFGLTADASVMASTNLLQGLVTLANVSSNIWVISGVVGTSSQSIQYYVSGSKSLSGALDRVRITTVNGTDTFDTSPSAGSINILYE
jgi:hypothetical protein